MEKYIEIIEKMMLVMALNTIDGDRMYPALEASKQALEKQIPQAVKEFLPLNRAKCPACNGIMGAHASRKYCYYCGQALDWSDTE